MQVSGVALELLKTAPREVCAKGRTSANFADVLRAAGNSTHTVSRGENLSRICRDYILQEGGRASASAVYAAVDKVAQANGIPNRDLIRPGQRLDLSVLQESQGPAEAPAPFVAKAIAAPTPEADAFLAAATMPEFRAWAALSNPRALSGLGDLDADPELQALTAPAALPMAAMGPFASGAGEEFLPANVEVERALQLMDSMMNKEQTHMSALDVESPWSRLVAEPAHLTSEFGVRRDPLTRQWEHHEGIDLATQRGAEIKPYKDGTVVFSGWQNGYGKVVVVRHDDGLETVYGHNSKNLVEVGDRVEEDTPLALVGSSGRATGPHLHFEVRRNGGAIDPIPFLAPAVEVVAKAY